FAGRTAAAVLGETDATQTSECVAMSLDGRDRVACERAFMRRTKCPQDAQRPPHCPGPLTRRAKNTRKGHETSGGDQPSHRRRLASRIQVVAHLVERTRHDRIESRADDGGAAEYSCGEGGKAEDKIRHTSTPAENPV